VWDAATSNSSNAVLAPFMVRRFVACAERSSLLIEARKILSIAVGDRHPSLDQSTSTVSPMSGFIASSFGGRIAPPLFVMRDQTRRFENINEPIELHPIEWPRRPPKDNSRSFVHVVILLNISSGPATVSLRRSDYRAHGNGRIQLSTTPANRATRRRRRISRFLMSSFDPTAVTRS